MRKVKGIVKKWREENEDNFPTPSLSHSLRFLVQELSELDSEIMKMEDDKYARADDVPKLEEEVADCILMICTCISQIDSEQHIIIDRQMDAISRVLYIPLMSPEMQAETLESLLQEICELVDSPTTVLRDKLKKIEDRWSKD